MNSYDINLSLKVDETLALKESVALDTQRSIDLLYRHMSKLTNFTEKQFNGRFIWKMKRSLIAPHMSKYLTIIDSKGTKRGLRVVLKDSRNLEEIKNVLSSDNRLFQALNEIYMYVTIEISNISNQISRFNNLNSGVKAIEDELNKIFKHLSAFGGEKS